MDTREKLRTGDNYPSALLGMKLSKCGSLAVVEEKIYAEPGNFNEGVS